MPASDSAPVRLDGLDGIRGLAALYVALFHALTNTGYVDTLRTEPLSMPMHILATLLNYGSYAVPVFIVLSGFCLMLPLAQRDTLTLSGGVRTFLGRRAWRILPSYYGALLLSLGLITAVPLLRTFHHTSWDNKLPITAGAIISHLMLVQNIRSDWLYRINGPMWSVAIEWQIYFLFPILLLIWRRLNATATVAIAMAVGVVPHFILPASMSIDHSNPWFLGLFAMGMAAARIACSSRPDIATLRARVPWRWLARMTGLLVVGALAWGRDWMNWHPYISEPLVGLAVAVCLIEYRVARQRTGRLALTWRLLESRPLVGLGAFSYSIYLVHYPILSLINLETLAVPMSAGLRLLMMVTVATPIAVACSYGFYLLVERRSMQLRDRVVPGALPPMAHQS